MEPRRNSNDFFHLFFDSFVRNLSLDIALTIFSASQMNVPNEWNMPNSHRNKQTEQKSVNRCTQHTHERKRQTLIDWSSQYNAFAWQTVNASPAAAQHPTKSQWEARMIQLCVVCAFINSFINVFHIPQLEPSEASLVVPSTLQNYERTNAKTRQLSCSVAIGRHVKVLIYVLSVWACGVCVYVHEDGRRKGWRWKGISCFLASILC